MADYRAHITGATPAVNDVLLSVMVQVSTDSGQTWDDVEERRVIIHHERLNTVLDDATLTDPQKRQALAVIFKAEASAWGYQAAHATVAKLDALLSWPVDVAL